MFVLWKLHGKIIPASLAQTASSAYFAHIIFSKIPSAIFDFSRFLMYTSSEMLEA